MKLLSYIDIIFSLIVLVINFLTWNEKERSYYDKYIILFLSLAFIFCNIGYIILY
ncbi:MAG: hypothetical protein ACQEQD_04605 [Bacillota bacterium]